MLADFRLRMITRAAWFCVRCKWDVTSLVEPNNNELQESILDKAKADTSVVVAVLVGNLRIDAKRHSSKKHVRAIVETCSFAVR